MWDTRNLVEERLPVTISNHPGDIGYHTSYFSVVWSDFSWTDPPRTWREKQNSITTILQYDTTVSQNPELHNPLKWLFTFLQEQLCLLLGSAKEEATAVQDYPLGFFASNGWNLKQENTPSLLVFIFSLRGEFSMGPRTQINKVNANPVRLLAQPAVLTTRASSITCLFPYSLTAWSEQHSRCSSVCFTE